MRRDSQELRGSTWAVFWGLVCARRSLPVFVCPSAGASGSAVARECARAGARVCPAFSFFIIRTEPTLPAPSEKRRRGEGGRRPVINGTSEAAFLESFLVLLFAACRSFEPRAFSRKATGTPPSDDHGYYRHGAEQFGGCSRTVTEIEAFGKREGREEKSERGIFNDASGQSLVEKLSTRSGPVCFVNVNKNIPGEKRREKGRPVATRCDVSGIRNRGKWTKFENRVPSGIVGVSESASRDGSRSCLARSFKLAVTIRETVSIYSREVRHGVRQ